ncbi:uncharacterized protein LOC110820538 [Carica papaya]|uniref:uncharacterized protein LOC110820538 n=1 Tax=Carica papaya TaxID=3649 RepID=UPI000B8CD97C|nr:uncharacterized protein LOC110820538 [Carica papaya]
MYRSNSWSRFADDYYMHSSPAMRPSSVTDGDDREPPPYDSNTETESKKPRSKFAENAVHVIPFVLFLCALILWFFSTPDIDVKLKLGDSIAARIEGLTIEGDMDNDSDGTQTGFLPTAELLDLGKPNRMRGAASVIANKKGSFKRFK